ncbi:MAG: hypothetical protein Q4G48_02990 [Bacteroidia bacterium]|nr:hypothetical protein [Bacteroidia bacterium]
MNDKAHIELDFVIDKITNSIQNTITGDSFRTVVSRLKKNELKNITQKKGWNFNWKKELDNDKLEVYKITIEHNIDVIQGLISFSIENDHIYINLLENAPFNIGNNKVYEGVAGNLVAFACKTSFQRGFDGFVAFTAKSKLIPHYEKNLGACRIGGQRMIIATSAARTLVEKYFKT